MTYFMVDGYICIYFNAAFFSGYVSVQFDFYLRVVDLP